MKYLKTADELLFESLINESIVYFSPELRDILVKVSPKSEVASKLCKIEGTNTDVDFTLIDWGNKGYFSFMQMPKAIKLIKNVWPNASDADIDKSADTKTSDILYRNDDSNYKFTGVWKGGQRNQIKIGKLIGKLLPNQFSAQQIEDFVNQVKSLQGWWGDFELVSGEKINFWYKSANYENLRGSLGGSCMKDSENLKLYTRNPEVCQLLILKRFDKLAARALVWKLHDSNIPDKPQYFMDRVYTSKDSEYKLFQEESDKRGWARRVSTRSSDYDGVVYRGKEYFGVSMSVKVNRGDYKTYPYLDTFKTYNPNSGILTNQERYSDTKPGDILLTSTQGSFSTTSSNQGFFRRIGTNIRTRLNPPPVIEARDTWSRAEDRDWVLLKRSGVPDIPSGDEATDYFKRYEPINVTQEDLIKLKSIVSQFNKPCTQDEPTFRFDCVTDGGHPLKKTAVSTHLHFRSPVSFNWSCKFWFIKRTFMSEDWWVLHPINPQVSPIDWNSYTMVFSSDYILCDGLRGVEDFLKSYTGEKFFY